MCSRIVLDVAPGLDPLHHTPFLDAEEAWLWAMRCFWARDDGARFTADMGEVRACEPVDLLRFVDRLRQTGRITRRHVFVLESYGRRLECPNPQRRDQEMDARLWAQALDRLETVLRSRGLVVPPEADGANGTPASVAAPSAITGATTGATGGGS